MINKKTIHLVFKNLGMWSTTRSLHSKLFKNARGDKHTEKQTDIATQPYKKPIELKRFIAEDQDYHWPRVVEGDGSVGQVPGDVPLDEGVASLQLEEAGDVPGNRE